MNAARHVRPATDADRAVLQGKAMKMLAEFNDPASGDARRAALLPRLLGTWNGAVIRPPFRAAYGRNIHFDEACFVNAGCTIEDLAEVRIGAFTQISSGVRILTADPVRPERAPRAITIGRNVWIGAAAVVHPGVRIGDDAIVSGGAVVTGDVPEGATVGGDPARVIG